MKKERILRVLGIKRVISFKDLVRESNVSKSYLSEVLKVLRERGLILMEENIKVIDLIEFLRFWGEEKRKILKRVNSFLTDTLFINDFLSVLSNKDYVLSGQFVENLITKQSSGISLWVYVFDESTYLDLIKSFGKKRSGRIRVMLYDDHIKYGSSFLQGYRIVALEQLTADLIAEGIFTDIKVLLE